MCSRQLRIRQVPREGFAEKTKQSVVSGGQIGPVKDGGGWGGGRSYRAAGRDGPRREVGKRLCGVRVLHPQRQTTLKEARMDETLSLKGPGGGERTCGELCVCNCPLRLWVRHFMEVSSAFPKCTLCGMLIV